MLTEPAFVRVNGSQQNCDCLLSELIEFWLIFSDAREICKGVRFKFENHKCLLPDIEFAPNAESACRHKAEPRVILRMSLNDDVWRSQLAAPLQTVFHQPRPDAFVLSFGIDSQWRKSQAVQLSFSRIDDRRAEKNMADDPSIIIRHEREACVAMTAKQIHKIRLSRSAKGERVNLMNPRAIFLQFVAYDDHRLDILNDFCPAWIELHPAALPISGLGQMNRIACLDADLNIRIRSLSRFDRIQEIIGM